MRPWLCRGCGLHSSRLLLDLNPSCPVCHTPAVDGKWQAWATWGGCSATCGGGSQRRERLCSGPFFGGAACQGPQDEFRQCSTQRCPGEICLCQPSCGPWCPGGGGMAALSSEPLSPLSTLVPRQSPMRYVMKTASAPWSGRRRRRGRRLRSGVPEMPLVRTAWRAHRGVLFCPLCPQHNSEVNAASCRWGVLTAARRAQAGHRPREVTAPSLPTAGRSTQRQPRAHWTGH